MRRLIPLLAAVAALTIAAIVTVVAVGASSGGSEKSASRQATGDEAKPGVAAMCVEGVSDCNDMALGGGGGGSEDMCIADAAADQECSDTIGSGSRCAETAAPDCAAIDGPATDPGDQANPPSNGGTGGTAYDITIPFDESVNEEDTKLVMEIVLAFDPNASFLLQESFPPTGRATLTSSDLDLCAAIESKLEGIPSVGDVTCAVSANVNPPCCKPDAPVSSSPAGEPGVNPSEPGSPPTGPTSE